MKFYLCLSIFLYLFLLSCGQYHAQYRNPAPAHLPGPQLRPSAPIRVPYPEPVQRPSYEPSRPVTPNPLILSHRQAQTHDGGFKYAFQTDNGLQQGETINPDGTRTGEYSYVDPHGQQITVKYTAGKEGFRILEGPHRTPESAPHVPQQQHQQQPQPQPIQQPIYQQFDLSGRPQTFSEDRYTQAFPRPEQPSVVPALQALPRYLTYKSPPAEDTSPSNNVIQNEPEYHDEPGKPHSFGSGYSFEFSG